VSEDGSGVDEIVGAVDRPSIALVGEVGLDALPAVAPIFSKKPALIDVATP